MHNLNLKQPEAGKCLPDLFEFRPIQQEASVNRIAKGVLSTALVLVVTSSTWAQKYVQRWTPPRPAYESRVISCQQPVPAPGWRIAIDDWVCPKTGRIVRVDWWGIVLTQQQLNGNGLPP